MRQEKKYLGNYRKKEIRVFMKGSLQMFTHPVLKSIFQGTTWGIARFSISRVSTCSLFYKISSFERTKTLFDQTVSIDPLLFFIFNPYALVPDVQYCTVLYFWFQYTWAVTPREINRAKTQKLKIYGQVVPAIRLN